MESSEDGRFAEHAHLESCTEGCLLPVLLVGGQQIRHSCSFV